jgi:hypothetical protein
MKLLLLVAALAVPSVALADTKAWTSGKTVISSSAKIVGGISAASVRSSQLYQQMLPLALGQVGDAKHAIDAMQKECSIDVLATIDSLAFGVDDGGAGVFVIAFKGTNRKALEACAQTFAKADNKTVTITQDGKLTKYEGMGDKAVYLDWLAPDVVALSTTTDDKDASLKFLSAGVTSNKTIKSALAAVNKNATMWFVVDKEVPLADLGGSMKQMYGTLVVANKKIDVAAHVVVSDAKSATLVATGLTKKVSDVAASAGKTIQAALATVAFKAVGSEVVGTGSIAEDDVLPLLMNLH